MRNLADENLFGGLRVKYEIDMKQMVNLTIHVHNISVYSAHCWNATVKIV